MTMLCRDALALVPAYLDGEVSEAQAAPLRKHLLSCHPCRTAAQEGKSLGRWFVSGGDSEEMSAPAGFAAHVARRAFAGDSGERSGSDTSAGPEQQRDLLRFVVHFSLAAASVMLLVALSIRSQELPQGGQLHADDRVAPPLEEVIEALDELNGRASALSKPPEESEEPWESGE